MTAQHHSAASAELAAVWEFCTPHLLLAHQRLRCLLMRDVGHRIRVTWASHRALHRMLYICGGSTRMLKKNSLPPGSEAGARSILQQASTYNVVLRICANTLGTSRPGLGCATLYACQSWGHGNAWTPRHSSSSLQASMCTAIASMGHAHGMSREAIGSYVLREWLQGRIVCRL